MRKPTYVEHNMGEERYAEKGRRVERRRKDRFYKNLDRSYVRDENQPTTKSRITFYAQKEHDLHVKRLRDENTQLMYGLLPSNGTEQLAPRTFLCDGILYRLKRNGDDFRISVSKVGDNTKVVIRGSVDDLKSAANELEEVRSRLTYKDRVRQADRPRNWGINYGYGAFNNWDTANKLLSPSQPKTAPNIIHLSDYFENDKKLIETAELEQQTPNRRAGLAAVGASVVLAGSLLFGLSELCELAKREAKDAAVSFIPIESIEKTDRENILEESVNLPFLSKERLQYPKK